MIKISVTKYTIYSKNYIIFTKLIKNFLKKEGISLGIIFSYFFSKLMLLSVKSTFHTRVSPFSNSRISLIIFGTEVDKVPPVDCTLVLYFNSIPPIILLIVFILLY